MLVATRRDELALQLEYRPKAIDAQIMLKHLKDFTQNMPLATPKEKRANFATSPEKREGEQLLAHPQPVRLLQPQHCWQRFEESYGVAPRAGLEPATKWLTATRSAD
jgi:hypothetical protein